MILLREPRDWFVKLIEPVPVRETTRAYITGVFLSWVNPIHSAQFDSTVLAFAEARNSGNFERYQELGDWILWSLSFVPEHHSGHETIVVDVGRRSYEACWRLLRGKWDLYAELAEEFPTIVDHVRSGLK